MKATTMLVFPATPDLDTQIQELSTSLAIAYESLRTIKSEKGPVRPAIKVVVSGLESILADLRALATEPLPRSAEMAREVGGQPDEFYEDMDAAEQRELRMEELEKALELARTGWAKAKVKADRWDYLDAFLFVYEWKDGVARIDLENERIPGWKNAGASPADIIDHNLRESR